MISRDFTKNMARWALVLAFSLLALLVSTGAMAKTEECQVIKNCKVYSKADCGSKVIGTLSKGDVVYVKAIKGKWDKVQGPDSIGYTAKACIKSTQSERTGAKGSSLQQVQSRLASLGYIGSQAVTGKMNDATHKGVRIFQMMNGMSVTGKLTSTTKARILSGSAKKRKAVNGVTWSKSGIDGKLRDGGIASVIDLTTGKRFKIRRVGGSNHLDVEPKSARDTAVIKKMYGGAWSWNSRPILLIADGTYYAAAMNGMPHGDQMNKQNNFNGHFCIHLKDSKTHGTNKENGHHQANINKVIAYF